MKHKLAMEPCSSAQSNLEPNIIISIESSVDYSTSQILYNIKTSLTARIILTHIMYLNNIKQCLPTIIIYDTGYSTYMQNNILLYIINVNSQTTKLSIINFQYVSTLF